MVEEGRRKDSVAMEGSHGATQHLLGKVIKPLLSCQQLQPLHQVSTHYSSGTGLCGQLPASLSADSKLDFPGKKPQAPAKLPEQWPD